MARCDKIIGYFGMVTVVLLLFKYQKIIVFEVSDNNDYINTYNRSMARCQHHVTNRETEEVSQCTCKKAYCQAVSPEDGKTIGLCKRHSKPQTNAVVERFNKTLKRMICSYITWSKEADQHDQTVLQIIREDNSLMLNQLVFWLQQDEA